MTNRLSSDERAQLDHAETHAFDSPIPCQVISNGEFLPARQGLLQKRFEMRLKERADSLASKHGVSRRTFLRTASGMASAFLAMNEVYGAVFQVSEAEAADPELGDEHARQLSDQFVVDVHTHFLKDDTRLKAFVDMRTDTGRRGYNPELARHAQTLEDVKFPTYVKEVFLDSDTKIAVLSGAPSDVPRDWMLSNDTIRHACDRVNHFAGSERMLPHFIFVPGQPGWLEAIDRGIELLKPAGWKGYTIGDNTHKEISRYPWRMDDADVTYRGYEKFAKSGHRVVAVHKGLFPPSDETRFPRLTQFAKVDGIFIPFFGLAMFLLFGKIFLSHKKTLAVSFIVLLIMLLPILQSVFSSQGLIRWQQISVFSNPPKNQTIYDHIAINYFRHFSISFLFLKGDIGMPGQTNTYDSVRGMGELYLFQLPLILIGVYKLFKDKTKTKFVLLLWLLLYPMGSMFTDRESPLARRSIIGVIPFQILSAYGLFYFLESIEKIKKFKIPTIVLTVLIILFSFYYYLYLYFVTYPNYSSDYYGFQYGSKQIVTYFAAHESNYDDLVMSPYIFDPAIYFKFYAPGDCLKCKAGFPDALYNSSRKQLFALPPYYLSSHPEFVYDAVGNIYYPNGTVAFVLTKVTEKTNGTLLKKYLNK